MVRSTSNASRMVRATSSVELAPQVELAAGASYARASTRRSIVGYSGNRCKGLKARSIACFWRPTRRVPWRSFLTCRGCSYDRWIGRSSAMEMVGSRGVKLADIRHLSAGHVFIGSTCSFFSRLAWNLMVARHGRDIPYVSVEACSPHLFREDTSPEELERTKQSDLANPDQRWAASSVVGNHGGY